MARDNGKNLRCVMSRDPAEKSIRCWYNEPDRIFSEKSVHLNEKGYVVVKFYGTDFTYLHNYSDSFLDLDNAHCFEECSWDACSLTCSKDISFIRKQVSELKSEGEDVKLLF